MQGGPREASTGPVERGTYENYRAKRAHGNPTVL